ncbi:MAG: ribonuclease P [Candidatus Iainarchaeum archaeon]|uniref:Ribonuclease P protein component 4 n=1 Tax=Candidatus Iainarchaeum sp. TaxID=3101447 RepID=A0A7T9DJZ6_9ARCH|nr:MAG: ribonuclease P [Candidatus Diapherotrites archaeon]
MATENRFVRPLTGQQKIAVERMHRLRELAAGEAEEHPARSQRYGQLVKQLSMRFRVPIPLEIKNRFCKHCWNYWIEGKTVTRRLKNGTWNSVCKICGELTRRKAGKARLPLPIAKE